MLPVAILAGGLATRLGPITEHVPKALVDVAGHPFAAHQIALLHRHGVDDITFLVGYLGEMVQRELGDGSRWGVRLRYVFDGPVPLGTGGAIRRALPQIGDPFFVLYGDSYLECDYEAIAQTFLTAREQGLMTVCRNDDRWDRSNVLFEHGRVVQYDKVAPSTVMRHIDYGLGVFRHAAFANWPDGQVFDLAAVYQGLLAGNDLAGVEVPTRFYEIGSPQGLEEARAYLSGKESPGR
jgi:MurNAc alpha-1-phosphate uridylyltransferase